MRTGMHWTRIEHSPQLQSVWKFLRATGEAGATTWEITQSCRVMNPATVISHLRANGLEISCTYEGMTGNKAKVYRYRLKEVGK